MVLNTLFFNQFFEFYVANWKGSVATNNIDLHGSNIKDLHACLKWQVGCTYTKSHLGYVMNTIQRYILRRTTNLAVIQLTGHLVNLLCYWIKLHWTYLTQLISRKSYVTESCRLSRYCSRITPISARRTIRLVCRQLVDRSLNNLPISQV